MKTSGNWLPAGFGKSLKFRNPGDLCNVTPNHRLNTRDKILTIAPALQGSRPGLPSTLHRSSAVCVPSYRETPRTWIYCSKTPRQQPAMCLGGSPAHTLRLTCWGTCAGGRRWRLLRFELHTKHETVVFVPLTRGNIYMLKQACATTLSILG